MGAGVRHRRHSRTLFFSLANRSTAFAQIIYGVTLTKCLSLYYLHQASQEQKFIHNDMSGIR